MSEVNIVVLLFGIRARKIMTIATQLGQLFERYQNAFIAYDIDTLSDCYHLPCTLNTPEQITLLTNKVDCQQEFETIFSQLKEGNINKVIAKQASYKQVSEQLYLVCIEWDFIDAEEDLFADFAAIYHILVSDSGLSIINVTSHDLECALSLPEKFSW